MDPTKQFIAEIDAFLKRSEMTATNFGKGAANDPNLVGDLRAGREPRWRTVQRVRDFIRQQDKRRERASA